MNTLDDALREFEKQFVNNHNRGEERFLRGLFIEEFYDFLRSVWSAAEAAGREMGEEEKIEYISGMVDEILTPKRIDIKPLLKKAKPSKLFNSPVSQQKENT